MSMKAISFESRLTIITTLVGSGTLTAPWPAGIAMFGIFAMLGMFGIAGWARDDAASIAPLPKRQQAIRKSLELRIVLSCRPHPLEGNGKPRTRQYVCSTNAIVIHILQHEREPQSVGKVQIIKGFRQFLVRPVYDFGLREADAPGIQRVDRKRRLEAHATAEEVHACTANVTVTVAAEQRRRRRDLLIYADAPTGPVLAGAV